MARIKMRSQKIHGSRSYIQLEFLDRLHWLRKSMIAAYVKNPTGRAQKSMAITS